MNSRIAPRGKNRTVERLFYKRRGKYQVDLKITRLVKI